MRFKASLTPKTINNHLNQNIGLIVENISLFWYIKYMNKIQIDPDEEIIIQGRDVLFMLDAFKEIFQDFTELGIEKKKNRDKAHKVTVHMAAAIIGLIRMMPRGARKSSLELFGKIMGLDLKEIEKIFNK